MTDEAVKKTVKLYDGEITIEFNNKARNRYVVLEDGHSPVGVTTVLAGLAKPGLALWPMYEAIDWLKKNPDDFEGAEKAYLIKSDKGKSVGTDVHAALENYLNGRGVIMSDDIFKPYMAFNSWFADNDPKVLATEQIIYSKKYDYAGTYDVLLDLDGKVVLCDIKTTNASRSAPLGIYPEYLLQLGAYSLAHHEENPLEKVDDLMVIRVGKDGVLNTLTASQLGFKVSFLEDTFKQLIELYKFMTPLTKQLGEMKSAAVIQK